ncbi:MAG: Calx-beta domain-containing protein, partial [Vicinamibacteria bacterium]
AVHDCPRHGILGADQDTGDVTLEHVEVYENGSGTQYHQVYMSADEAQFPNAVFRMRFSYVHDSNGGNSVKSRAARNEIHYNWIEGALYHELDLIGSEEYAEALVREDSEVVGNVLVKSASSQGHVARIGGDGTGQTDGRYRFAHNTMILAAGAGTPTVMRLQDQVGSLQLSDNVVFRQGGGPFVVIRTAEEAAPLAVHAGQNNWVASNASGVRPEWTGTVAGTNPGFANLGAWNLTPVVGSAIHDAGVLPTSGPPGASFPNPLPAPLFHPPVRTAGLPGSEQARPLAPPIDIGAYEADSAPVVPLMTIDDAGVTEGSAGTTPAMFVVRLSAATTVPVTVAYATANGTATAPADYAAASGTLTFAAGATAQNVVVQVVGDTAVEPDETFVLNLSSAAGATIADAQATGSIADDDAPPLAGVELAHGTALVRSLQGTSGQETLRLAQAPRASYEVQVDAASGDISPMVLERLGADQTTVLQSSSAVGTGTGRRLAWHNTSTAAVSNQGLRVRSSGCTTACGADDTFRVRAWETTYAVPRFNNSGTQATVLIVQNATERALSGRAYFWSAAGAALGSHPFTLAAHATLVVNTATVSGVAGQGGSVTIAHDGGYGALAGKAVALEPSTGFSFDSPMAPRSR